MSADYAPGTVAAATVRGVKGVRVVRVQSTAWTTPWVTPQPGPWRGVWHNDTDVTDVRPLVVLDLAGYTDAVEIVRGHALREGSVLLRSIADQIEAQTKPPRIPEPGLWGDIAAVIRAKIDEQTKPPRIPEPGLWGVVQSDGRNYVRTTEDTEYRWRSGDYTCRWTDLNDPVLVRDGVTP